MSTKSTPNREIGERYRIFLRQGLGNYSLWAISGQLSHFVNKVLLEHNDTHSFTYYLWLLWRYNGRLGQLQTSQGPQSQNINYLAFFRKLAHLCFSLPVIWHSFSGEKLFRIVIDKNSYLTGYNL